MKRLPVESKQINRYYSTHGIASSMATVAKTHVPHSLPCSLQREQKPPWNPKTSSKDLPSWAAGGAQHSFFLTPRTATLWLCHHTQGFEGKQVPFIPPKALHGHEPCARVSWVRQSPPVSAARHKKHHWGGQKRRQSNSRARTRIISTINTSMQVQNLPLPLEAQQEPSTSRAGASYSSRR